VIPSPAEAYDPTRLEDQVQNWEAWAAKWLNQTFAFGTTEQRRWDPKIAISKDIASELMARLRRAGWLVRWDEHTGDPSFYISPAPPPPPAPPVRQPWYCFWR
jgi:hypothetical protein